MADRDATLLQQQQRCRCNKKLTFWFLITVILLVPITCGIIVVIKKPGSRRSALYSRSYTLGDTSLTTVDTETCPQVSIDLEYGKHTKTEVLLDVFSDDEKPTLIPADILKFDFPVISLPSSSNKLMMNTYIHAGSFAYWTIQLLLVDCQTLESGLSLIFRNQSDYYQWTQWYGNLDLVYWSQRYNTTACSASLCHLTSNYTTESDFYHVIARIADPHFCNLDVLGSIDVHRKQYKVPDRTHGCIVNASSTSCQLSTERGPNVLIAVLEMTGSKTANWKDTVHVSLRCLPHDELYVLVGVPAVIGVFLLICVFYACIGVCLLRHKNKGKGVRSCDSQPSGETTSSGRDTLPDSVVNKAPENGENRRVLDASQALAPFYQAIN